MSTPTPVSIVCVKERFGSLSIPTPVSMVPVDGEIWMCEHSYSCVYCLYEREVW